MPTTTTTPPTTALTDAQLLQYWNDKAAKRGAAPDVTIRDLHYLDLECEKVASYLSPTHRVLDVGCGTGITTRRYAKHCKSIIGVDFSAEMIAHARRMLGEEAAGVAERIEFMQGDARDIKATDATFDRVISQRCLINIPDRNEQVAAMREYARVLKPGGLALVSEVTLQGHERVNHYREMFGLSKLKVHWHNTYVDEGPFLKAISPEFEQVEIVRFGMYGFLSKVIVPMLAAPAEPSFDDKLNEIAKTIAAKLPDFDGCIHHVLFVLRRKA